MALFWFLPVLRVERLWSVGLAQGDLSTVRRRRRSREALVCGRVFWCVYGSVVRGRVPPLIVALAEVAHTRCDALSKHCGGVRKRRQGRAPEPTCRVARGLEARTPEPLLPGGCC